MLLLKKPAFNFECGLCLYQSEREFFHAKAELSSQSEQRPSAQ